METYRTTDLYPPKTKISFLHRLAHLIKINLCSPHIDEMRSGYVCVGCGKFTPWTIGKFIPYEPDPDYDWEINFKGLLRSKIKI